MGAMAAAINLFVRIPVALIVVPKAISILTLQIWGSYTLIRNIFRWLALVLLAHIGSALLAKPELGQCSAELSLRPSTSHKNFCRSW
jgi:hypothetical protein